MIAIITLLLVLMLSILVTRIASIALSHTGMSKEIARFQARSAFTGVGFTTGEAEKVVQHPVRRRIVLLLMLLGNAGIVTAISSLILTFISSKDTGSLNIKIISLIVGLTILWVLAQSEWVDRRLSRIISWALKRYTQLDIKDYASILQLAGNYRVSELQVESRDWLAHKRVKDLHLRDEGVLILGIHRASGKYLGAPNRDTEIYPDDTLILYGRDAIIESLDRRQKGFLGDMEHVEAVKEQKKVEEEQEEKEDDSAEK
ncbi:potassium transporter TrkA [candidate division KSB1 bacterium]|nr:potassium transporter TrkA [candidate division KSB1 bacterium]NIR69817.1 potassium transporter TrkA [candidate division KSB1 bacterium]NIS25808.1 potassium transporter TrkA [candidate division KSB1 bacterium]NIT72682.1 potassium transporter TrkA [candidate division KSB1 bacterium]NIU26497.1 potassium transporter TrkA [candidate division KSB1 bacterium]